MDRVDKEFMLIIIFLIIGLAFSRIYIGKILLILLMIHDRFGVDITPTLAGLVMVAFGLAVCMPPVMILLLIFSYIDLRKKRIEKKYSVGDNDGNCR